MFGAFALAFMAMPLRISEGVNIDPRAVPVALTAACLGLRGGAVTLLMAIGMRLWIGGTGTGAGIALILFSAIAGFAWNQGTWSDARSARDYLSLGTQVGLGLWTIVLLPTPAAVGVLSNSLPLVLPCMFFVPLTAFLLDRTLALPVGSRGRSEF